MGFASAFSFKYSRRPGTPAAAMADQVPESGQGGAARAPCRRCSASQARAFNASKVGADLPVLFAEPGRQPGQLVGRRPWLQAVHAEGNARLIGRIVEARLVEGHANSLAGEIVTACPTRSRA